jgi:amidohydrolase
MNLSQKIKSIAHNHKEELINIRHHLHANPELSMQEKETSFFIQTELKKIGIKFQSGVAGYGIVALIHGKNPDKKTIALRADMDALPIIEKNEVPYKSKNEGVMHACGHDVHSTCLLGAAKILHELKDEFEGSIKLIFQPSEEKLPGGASLMINEGVLENPIPQAIVALHVFPSMETGNLGFREGMYMASCDEIYIKVKGKGGHAAIPAELNNPLFISADLLMTYNKLIEELKLQSIPTVLSFGKIIGNGATNVVPDEVSIDGTFRTMNEEWRFKVHENIRGIAKMIALKYKCEIECRVEIGYPYLINDSQITKTCSSAAKEYLGAEKIETLDLRMASEDFSYYSQKAPSCFFRLGTRNKEKGITSPVHTSTFDIDENAIEIGAGAMAYLSISLLNSN